MHLYSVMFLIPKTGNRILMEGVTAEVEMISDQEDLYIQGSSYPKPIDLGHTYLDIVLEVHSIDHDQLEEIKQELFSDKLFLHFKDTHPCLIKGRVTGVTIDSQKTTIRFVGNTTDKTYEDYIAECTNQFNAYQFHVDGYPDLTQPNDPIDDGIVYPPEPEKKRKDIVQVFKRKLTF